MRILFLGDIVGRPGRAAVKKRLARLRESLAADLVLANGENASGGIGLSAKNARELLNLGIDALTGGNHTFRNADLHPLLDAEPRLLRPANLPPGVPGAGLRVLRRPGLAPLAVLNLQGRTFMPEADCPFRAADAILAALAERDPDVRCIVVDLHAEATSEKQALGWHLDGRVSAVLGTHTHVQTNDARLLPGGAAYVTDLGMCGPRDGCLGMKRAGVLRRFLTGLPERFEPASGPCVLQGACFELDESTGRAVSVALVHEEVA
ncbi:MAG: TIGR00282 family metallophosphoesterase [Desulfovibrionaceae bacterium]